MSWSPFLRFLILLTACRVVDGSKCSKALDKLNSEPSESVVAYMYEHVNCKGEVLTVHKDNYLSVMPEGWDEKVSSMVVRKDCTVLVTLHPMGKVSHIMLEPSNVYKDIN